MPDTNIAFANIVPNTTPASWSQAYNAGKLFAVLSLEKEAKEGESESALNILGKEVISTFEQEFFTLENKDLDSIKNAISLSIEKIKELSSFSFVITYISGSVLYVFIAGSGSVILKRGSKLGTILDADTGTEVKSASGFLQNDDLVILQTKNFTKIVNIQTLAGSLDGNSPSSISEALAPKVHEKQDGSAAASILLYKDEKVVETLSSITQDIPSENLNTGSPASAPLEIPSDNFSEISLESLENDTEEKEDENPKPAQEEVKKPEEKPTPEPSLTDLVLNAEEEPEEQSYISNTKRGFSIPKIGISGLGHRRRLLASVAVIIVVVLAISIILGIKNNGDKKVKAEFAQIYPQASEKVKEGESLKDLNSELARQDFQDAKNLLLPNKDKFKSGSSEDKQIEDLLSQVNGELAKTSGANNSEAKEVASSSSLILSTEINNPSVSYFTQDDKNVYFIDNAGIQQVVKSTNKKTQLVKKSWTSAAGIGAFLGNLYLLDNSADQIYKFAATSLTKSNYLTVSPDLSEAVSMTIDGSIYVLSKDGSILKFLRGASETFSLKGLDKPLSSSTRIQTDADSTNLYILDNGNSRIVVLSKTGSYVAQYSASVIKNAKDFEVLEASKKINVLSGGKVYQIDLK